MATDEYGTPDAPTTTPPAGSPGLPAPPKPKPYVASEPLHLAGFDDANLANASGNDGKYTAGVGQFAGAIQGLAPTTAGLAETISRLQSQGINARMVGTDKIDMGDGKGPIDAITDVGGPKSNWWFNNDNGGNGRGGGGGGGTPDRPYGSYGSGSGSGSGGGGSGGSGGWSESGPQGGDGWYGTTPGQGTDLYNQLMARSKQGLAIDKNDPIIRNQADAHNVTLERGRTQYLEAEAERGGANSNMGAERRASAEKVGQGSADFESALMGREVQARREEIQNALSGMGALLTAEQQMQLQEELAQLSRSESRYQFDAGLSQRESEFGRDLGQRGYEFDNNDRYRNSPLGPGN